MKCPACGTTLEAQLVLGTDYSEISKIQLNNQQLKPPEPRPTISGEDPYLSLPWKQSLKKSNLGTLLVTTELIQNTIARDLYDKLKEWKTMRVCQITYRYSQMDNGTEFLQQWRPIQE